MPDLDGQPLLGTLERIAEALERIAPAPRWLTREQAARHLQISTPTLDRVVSEKGHLDGSRSSTTYESAG